MNSLIFQFSLNIIVDNYFNFIYEEIYLIIFITVELK